MGERLSPGLKARLDEYDRDSWAMALIGLIVGLAVGVSIAALFLENELPRA
jgi:uncharacterized membrane-anchored protein YhcB (DUF1043 family)